MSRDLAGLVADMRVIVKAFRALSVDLPAPAFQEFAGLLLDYVAIAERMTLAGSDFRTDELPIEDYEAQYLAERLIKIFGPALQVRSALYRPPETPEHGPRNGDFVKRAP